LEVQVEEPQAGLLGRLEPIPVRAAAVEEPAERRRLMLAAVVVPAVTANSFLLARASQTIITRSALVALAERPELLGTRAVTARLDTSCLKNFTNENKFSLYGSNFFA
jgi:hypothetical protein